MAAWTPSPRSLKNDSCAFGHDLAVTREPGAGCRLQSDDSHKTIRTFGLTKLVDSFISSCFVHLRKPDEKIFRLALDLTQTSAHQILYIADAVADTTIGSLLRVVPAAVPGVAFLPGGQSSELASAHLNAMNARFRTQVSWAVGFSFARALKQPAIEIWKSQEANAAPAQQARYHRARCNRAARRGEYVAAMEKTRR